MHINFHGKTPPTVLLFQLFYHLISTTTKKKAILLKNGLLETVIFYSLSSFFGWPACRIRACSLCLLFIRFSNASLSYAPPLSRAMRQRFILKLPHILDIIRDKRP